MVSHSEDKLVDKVSELSVAPYSYLPSQLWFN
ncbi:MAG: hypothetical protein ACJAZP_001898 [Psychromonas sp.]|jgi:hypothetical protein